MNRGPLTRSDWIKLVCTHDTRRWSMSSRVVPAWLRRAHVSFGLPAFPIVSLSSLFAPLTASVATSVVRFVFVFVSLNGARAAAASDGCAAQLLGARRACRTPRPHRAHRAVEPRALLPTGGHHRGAAAPRGRRLGAAGGGLGAVSAPALRTAARRLGVLWACRAPL